jgi:LPS-assembly protein
MKRQLRIVVSISIFVCHPFLLALLAQGQVTSQLHSPPNVEIRAESQEKAGDLYHLLGHVEITYADMRLNADRVDYSSDTGELVANGNVHFVRPKVNEEIWAIQGNYNLRTETGTFFHVVGSVGALVRGRASLLTTSNPFFFEAERVDKTGSDTYRVYNATITVCSLPDPTWSLAAREVTIHPNESAIIHRSKLRTLNLPVFYFPYFYRSLQSIPRSSGFLTPSFGNNSRLGTFIGDSYFWAINRSADAEIGAQFLSKRGWSQNGTFRMRAAQGSYLNLSYYGVVDRGLGPQKVDQGGRTVSAEGTMRLPEGFRGVVDLHYLSSLTFRQAFTQTYNEAVSSENHSTGFASKSAGSLSYNAQFSSLQDFQSTQPNDSITIRHLPEFSFDSVERPVVRGFPVWLSWNDSIGVVSRSEPTLPGGGGIVKTSLLERFEFNPRITIPLEWQGFHLTPTFGYRARHYGSERDIGKISSAALNVGTGELGVELAFPSLSRVYSSARPFYAAQWKHVIEPKLTFNYVSGERNFAETLLFDEGDLVSNTNQLELSITNRLFAKRTPTSSAQEVFSWELKQQYYFDPTFGGIVQSGRRNVFLPTLDFSGNAFITSPRRFSPIISVLRFRPFAHYDVEFRQDYDTTLSRFTNAAVLSTVTIGQTFLSASEFLVRTPDILSPPSDQTHFTVGYGKLGREGFNAAFSGAYDVRAGYLQFGAFQVSYNNNCCGISVEFRRFALGPVRNENQYRVAFSLANIGTFGNLKKEERLF